MSELNGSTLLNMIKLNGTTVYKKYKTWLDEHPDEPYCYSVVGPTFGASEAKNPDIIKKHPELVGSADRFPAIVTRDGDKGIKFSGFCAIWCRAIREMIAGGDSSGEVYGLHWEVKPDKDNFTLTVTKL